MCFQYELYLLYGQRIFTRGKVWKVGDFVLVIIPETLVLRVPPRKVVGLYRV